jgi:pimeloyl-ACP methyl ester carboxylesterase
VVALLIPCGIAVLALDFAGSGHSDGDYVTLGVREVDDVECAIAFLRSKNTSHIAMWGRSMGAVVCLLYGQRDPSIAGIVLDSPFSNLVTLMEELACGQGLRIPRYLIKSLIGFLRRSIKKRAGFDICVSDPLSAAESSFIPALFGHGKEDDFIAFEHSEKLFKAYAGDKNLISFEGNHNSPRPSFFNTSVMIFLHNVLGPFSKKNSRVSSPSALSPTRHHHPYSNGNGGTSTSSPLSSPYLTASDEVLMQEALALSLMDGGVSGGFS